VLRTLIQILILTVLTAALACAQKTRTEITRPSPGGADARPNSESVPDVYAIPTQFERVVILRFKFTTDLLDGLEKMAKQEKIRNGVIFAAVGSVRNYHVHSVSNRDLPSKNVFIKDPSTPADIVSMNGYIIDGRIHAHLMLSDGERSFGGHLEPGTNVFTFAAVTVGVLRDGADLSRIDDKTHR